MKMSGGVVAWVVCSFRPWLAVDSRLKPGHLLPQNCHLQQSSWSCIEWKSTLSNLHLLTRKGSVGFLHILPQADVLLLEESCSQSDLIFLQPSRLSWSVVTVVTQHIVQVKIKQPVSPSCCDCVLGSRLPVLVVLLLRRDKLLGSLPDDRLRAQLLHVKGTFAWVKVGTGNSCQGEVLQSILWWEITESTMFKPQAQTRSQLPVSCASPPSPSPTWRASTPCRGSRGCGEEHLVASYLRVWLIRKWTSWAKSPLETMMEGLETGLSSTRGGETELIMLGETQLSSSGSGLVSTLARLSAWASSWWTRWSDQAGRQSI